MGPDLTAPSREGSPPAAAARAAAIVAALVGFFLIGTPLQRLVARRAPGAAHRLPLLFCRSLLRLAKVRVEVQGAPAGGRAVLLVSNHVSWIDVPALGSVLPLCFLAKAEVRSWPLVSAFADVQGTVFVERNRRRSIPAANRDMAARLRQGRRVLLFPEGTTRGDPLPGRFLSSHFAAARDLLARRAGDATVPDEVAVQPVAVTYSSPAAAWVGADTLGGHLWRTLRGPPLTCRIGFGAPIPFRAGSDRKAVAAQAAAAVTAMVAHGRRSGPARRRAAEP